MYMLNEGGYVVMRGCFLLRAEKDGGVRARKRFREGAHEVAEAVFLRARKRFRDGAHAVAEAVFYAQCAVAPLFITILA